MKVRIIEDNCIGCGECERTCNSVFELNDEAISEVKVDTVSEELTNKVKEAIKKCPTDAIVEE